MSALLAQLSQLGVTNEDLEKAASARLFEKTAAAEGIDLSELDGGQQDELFAHFEANVLPGIVGKTASAPEATVEEKIAGLTQEDAYVLFEKQAAFEGVSAEQIAASSDEQLAYAYNDFIDNILPKMASQNWEPVEVHTAKEAEVAEATAKLAECEVLGRHMARAYSDELDKIAGKGEGVLAAIKGVGTAAGEAVTKARGSYSNALHGGKGSIGTKYTSGEGAGGAVKSRLKALGTAAMENKGVAAGVAGAGTLAAGTTALGAKTVYDHKKAASAPAFEELAFQRAQDYVDGTAKVASGTMETILDARAREILTEQGYEVEE